MNVSCILELSGAEQQMLTSCILRPVCMSSMSTRGWAIPFYYTRKANVHDSSTVNANGREDVAECNDEDTTDGDCYDCFFSSIYSFFDFPMPFHFTTGRGILCFCSLITLDFYLHQSVLLRRLRSSPYSSFPSPPHLFYNDASFRLGQALLGPCAFFLSI